MGIKSLKDGQIIFLDTPGIHKASTPLNRSMVKTALDTFGSADIILLLVDATAGVHKDDLFIIQNVQEAKLPAILLINKIDLIDKKALLPAIDQFRVLYHFIEIIPVSALNGNGISLLMEAVWKLLPEGPRFFPDDMITDRSERFIAAEMIREKITLLTHKEIPYVTAVMVDTFKEDEVKNLIRIQATIHVEKESQKGIIIGKKGAMLKQIGTEARRDMEHFFAARIFLELFVRVQKEWTHNKKMLQEFGYTGRS